MEFLLRLHCSQVVGESRVVAYLLRWSMSDDKRSTSCHQRAVLLSGHHLPMYSRLTGAVFLDVAKAFDTVWIEGLLYKLTVLNFPSNFVHIIS